MIIQWRDVLKAEGYTLQGDDFVRVRGPGKYAWSTPFYIRSEERRAWNEARAHRNLNRSYDTPAI